MISKVTLLGSSACIWAGTKVCGLSVVAQNHGQGGVLGETSVPCCSGNHKDVSCKPLRVGWSQATEKPMSPKATVMKESWARPPCRVCLGPQRYLSCRLLVSSHRKAYVTTQTTIAKVTLLGSPA